MPKKFNIPNNGSLIIKPGEGYYNPSGKQGQEDFKVFFGDYFEAMLSNAGIGTKENPTTVTAESYLTGGLDALNTTTAVVDLPKPHEITESRGEYVLRIKQETDPEIAYKNGKSLDAKWIKDGHQLIADTMTNAIKQKFPHVNTANIKIEILDWDGKNWFTTHPNASLYGTGETLFTLRFSANRWEKLWQGNEKECASKIGETFKCIEAGRQQAQQQYQTEKEINLHDYLDPIHTDKLKNLKKKHSRHYELKPEEFLLKNQVSYEFMCKVLHLPFDSFKQGFDRKSPASDGPNAFKASNSAAGFYFFRQKQLTNNLTELKISEGQDSPEKSRLSNALYIMFNENLLVKSVEAATLPNGNLIDAIQSDRDPLQNHLVNLEVCVHQRLLNFSISYKQDSGNPTIKNNNKSSASSSSSLPASESNNSNSSDESEIKDNALVADFCRALVCLNQMTASDSTGLPILKLFFEIISWHAMLLDHLAASPTKTKTTDELKKRERAIKQFCNSAILQFCNSAIQILSRAEIQNTECTKLVMQAKTLFEEEAAKKLTTAGHIINHIEEVEDLLEEASALRKYNGGDAFVAIPSKIRSGNSKELLIDTQNKFAAMCEGLSDKSLMLGTYFALVDATSKLVETASLNINSLSQGSDTTTKASRSSEEQKADELAHNFEQTVLKLLCASFQQPRPLPLKFYLQHALLFVRWYRMAIRNTPVSQLESFDVLYIKNRQERFLHAINRVIAEASEQMPADRNMFIQFIEAWNGLYNTRNKSSTDHSDRVSKLIIISEDNENKTLKKELEPTEEMLDNAILVETAISELETQDLIITNAKDSSTKKLTPCNLRPLYNAITVCAERFSNDAISVLIAQKCKK